MNKKLSGKLTFIACLILLFVALVFVAVKPSETEAEEAQAYDVVSVSDLGMGYVGEAKEYRKLDKDYRIYFSEENVSQSFVLKFYYKPSGTDGSSAIDVRIGFEDNWKSKVRFVLSESGKNIAFMLNDEIVETSENVFTDAEKEYFVEFGVIRADGKESAISATVDGVKQIEKNTDDIGVYGENNRIHFFTRTNDVWTIRDYREIDENYDEITLHDLYLTSTRLQKEELILSVGTGQFGSWNSTVATSEVVFRFYYNTGSDVDNDDPFYIRMKTTTGDHMWVGLSIKLNHFGTNNLTIDKEAEGDKGAVTVPDVFENRNTEYLVEIGTVGICDESDTGYVYVKVDGEMKLATTYRKDIYSGNWLSFWQTNNVKDRTIKSAETIRVYDENDSVIEEYYKPYKSKINKPAYEPQEKVADKYYEKYEYKYWSADGKTEFDFENTTAKKDVDLKPYYLGVNAKEYEITFKGYNSEQKVKYSKDSGFTEPDVPSKPHYKGQWENYELNYEEGQTVNAEYFAVLYKVLVKFTFDKRESKTFYFSADNTEAEIAAVLSEIQSLKPEDTANYVYKWDSVPESLELGQDYVFTLSKTEPSGGCSGSFYAGEGGVILLLAAVLVATKAYARRKKTYKDLYL